MCSYVKEDQTVCLNFFNDGHWAFLGPAEESKWYQGYATDFDGKWDLRASQNVGNFREFRTSGISGVSSLGRGILKKKNNRDTILFNGEYGNNDMLYRKVHAVNQLCIYGAVSKWCGPNSGEASQSRPESARKMSPEIQRKQEDFESLVDIPRRPRASGNRMLQNLLKDFNSMPFMSKIEYLRTTAKFYHPIEKGNYNVTTTLEDDGWENRTSMCKEKTAPRNEEDSKPYAAIDAEQEICPVLNFGIATVVDVLGIEVQV